MLVLKTNRTMVKLTIATQIIAIYYLGMQKTDTIINTITDSIAE